MIRFCFSGEINDHEAYPRALASIPPDGWTYRPTTVEFDADRGRPWARFHTRPGEVIHASSLLPTNGTAWIFETDHVGFVVQQAQASAAGRRKADVGTLERCVVESLTSDLCLGALVWSKASQAALEDMCERHAVAPPRITHAYPAVVPPNIGSQPESRELLATLGRLDTSAFKLLTVDGQQDRGASKVPRRKNVSAALECARRLRRDGARVELVVVGSTEVIGLDQNWLHVLPALSRGDLWHLYRAIDLVLFLSRQETFRYLPMEAMCSGVCCLSASATSLPAIPEIIEHRQTGVLVDFLEPKPYPALSDRLDIDRAVGEIAGLIAMPEERRRIVANARSLFGPGGRFSLESRNRILTERLLPFWPPGHGSSVNPFQDDGRHARQG